MRKLDKGRLEELGLHECRRTTFAGTQEKVIKR